MTPYITYPDIFENRVTAFFTGRNPGTDVRGLTGKKTVYFPVQKHTGNIAVVGSDLSLRKADAVITNRKDILIGVQVADCVPILLYDRKNGVNDPAIGVVHAGWRGTAGGILKNTIKEMKVRYRSEPEDILIAIGPAIRWCCYDVGSDVLEAVIKETGSGEYHTEKEGKHCLDLPSANKCQALSAGIPGDNIWMSGECTYCYPEKFYSYRYSKGSTGRQGGFIGMS